MLRVVRGDPTDEELAALVAVVAAAGSAAPSPVASSSTWGSWRTSARPR
jgi:hypothetical protein